MRVMIRHSIPLLAAAIITGSLLGGSIRYSIHNRTVRAEADEGIPSLTVTSDATAASVSPRDQSPLPRPTFEEVCKARGAQRQNILSRYLQDATIDEVVAVLEASVKKNSPLISSMWMAEIRGLELDPHRILAWRKSKGGTVTHLLIRWSALDPYAALEASLSEKLDVQQAVLQALKDADLDQAIAAVKALMPDAPELTELETLKWAELPEADIVAALQQELAKDDSEERHRILKTLIDVWSERDPLAAMKWIDTQDGLERTEQLLLNPIQHLTKQQPALAFEYLATLPPSRERTFLDSKVFYQWAAQDIEGALEGLKSIPQGMRRDKIFSGMFSTYKPDPEDLFRLLVDYDIDIPSTGDIRNLYVQFNHNIQQAALEIAKDSPRKALGTLYRIGLGHQEMSVIGGEWIKSDPEDAASWAMSLPVGQFASYAQSTLLTLWAKEDPPAAAAYFKERALTDHTYSAQTIADAWAVTDMDATLVWANQLEDKVRGDVLYHVISKIAESDPTKALQYVNGLENPNAQQRIITTATQKWRETDPVGTMNWLHNQPAEAGIEEIMKETAKAWVLNQPQAASQWIQNMEIGHRRDHAVAGMVDALISSTNPNKDFEGAATWAQEIQDPEIKQQWLDEIEKRR